MARSHRAYLDGLPLDTSAPVGWSYLLGPSPHIRDFTCDRRVAEQLVAQATPKGSVLVLDVDGHATETVEQLTIIGGLRPAARPQQAVIRVADLRYFWPDRRVYGRFNLRRRTGERRRPAPNLPLAVQPITDDVAFAPWTLDGEARWKVTALFQRVLGQLLQGGERFELRPLSVRSAPIEDLVLDDDGAGGVRRLLSYFGGAIDLFVDSDGTVVIFDRTDQSERRLVGLTASGRGSRTRAQASEGIPSVVGPPLWELSDRRHERPARVRVLFTRLLELRFDGKDSTTATVTGVGAERGDLPLDLELVLPVPDLTLDVPALNGKPARTVIQGTWVTFAEAIAGWNASGWPTGRTIDLETIRELYTSGGLMALFAPPELDEEGIYARRIHAAQAHYRQSYRLVRRWRDRLGELLPHRSELKDPENGTSAPAELYCDHATQLTWRGQEKAVSAKPRNCDVFVNRYAAGEGVSVHATPIGDMKPASALVQILDQDQGVLHFSFQSEQQLGEKTILFSAVMPSSIASIDPSGPVLSADAAWLAEGHEVSVVLSTVAVAPNDRRALHQEFVTPTDVEAFLTQKIGPCEGPEVTLRVPPHNLRAVARFAWDDARASEIRLGFALQDNDKGDPTLAFGDPLNPDELQQLAKAYAARYYLARLDHVVGLLATGWTPGLRPTGAAGPVVHEIAPGGDAITRVQFLDDLPVPEVYAFMPDSLRQVVLGEALP